MKKDTLKLFWRNRDLRNRLFVVLGILVVYSLMTHVPAPVPDVKRLQTFLLSVFSQSPVLGFANLFTGGALANFSIIAMGIGPYITASIVVQLMQQVIPSWEALSKEGERGRAKLNQYMRMLTVPFAIIQSFTVITLVRQLSSQSTGADLIGSPSIGQWVLMIASLTAGSLFLMWLGELITEKGFGNGISIIIAAGIIATLPGTIVQQAALVQGDNTQLLKVLALVGMFLATTYGVVMVNEAQRNIPISYARRSAAIGTYGSVDTHLPLRLITAGVIPVIFALTFLSIPTFLGQVLANASTEWVARLAQNMTAWFSPSSWIYLFSYFLLIFVFTFVYTSIIFKPKEIAENLQKQGGFIPGIRPGNETAKYLKTLISRLNFTGALALGIIAILPLLVEKYLNMSQAVAIGGTSVFILVSVAIETKRQLESRVTMATYERY
jgi:preprotein translocase subunit SecY